MTPQTRAGPSRAVAVGVACAAFAAFLPALRNGFVNWDDPFNLLLNPHYRGLGWPNIRWMFTTLLMGHYQPLTWLSLGLDFTLWGMEPFGYHLTSLLLHAANAVLFYLIAFRLMQEAASEAGDASLPAGLAALLFAVHPLRVESVVWVSERRDVLSGLFYLGTVLCHLEACAAERRGADAGRWRAAGLAAFTLSLLSKTIGVTLPLVLLVLDVYPLRRLPADPWEWLAPGRRAALLEKAPYFLIGTAAAAGLALAQADAGGLLALGGHGVVPRLADTVYGAAFYLWKTLVPLRLLPLYARPVRLESMAAPLVLSGAAVLAVSAVLIALRRRWPAGLAVWACYLLTLAPVLGLIANGPQLVADRYSYLSCLGWALLAGAGWRLSRPPARGVLAVAALGLLAALTWRQARVWRDSETLWTYALSADPRSALAHDQLGLALAEKGRFDEAVLRHREAVRLDPRFPGPHYHLARVLAAQGRVEEAVAALRAAVGADPGHEQAHYKLGGLLAVSGRLDEAASHLREAIRLAPDDVMAHHDLGLLLARMNRLDEAEALYREALRLEPRLAAAHNNLGNALAARGRYAEAVPSYERGLALSPGYAEAHANLGMVLALQGDFAGARRHCAEALRLKPGDPGVERVLANVRELERRAEGR